MDLPLISVIIPVYNAQRYLRQCIDSVITQTYHNLEIILIDDGSPDSCGEICDEYARLDNRIIVVHQKNQGIAVTRNTGLDLSRGELIAFVDSDDWIERDMFQKMSDMLIKKELDIVFCTANVIRNGVIAENRFCYYSDGSVVDSQEVLRDCLTDRIGGQLWLRLCRRHCLSNVRCPEGRLYEDLAISHLPFLYAKRPIGFIREPLYNYRLNPSGISLAPVPHKAYHIFLGFAEHCRYAEKYAPDVLEQCVAKTARHAVSVCNSAIKYPQADLLQPVMDADAFIAQYYKMLMGSNKVTLKWKTAFFIRRRFKGMYNAIFYVINLVRTWVNQDYKKV